MKTKVNLIVLFTTCFLLTSCYSVRLRSINGTPQPDPISNRDDYYRHMEVVEIDTVIKIDLTSKDFTYLIKETDKCKTGKLHTVEFRNTFEGSLLSMVTFGRKRKMKIKYVCMKPAN
ncbi:hypothetical protein [Mariniflexile sp. AS56]|uniref:hypothetical protein n=1 Tax=Mariniflexile sp. AS56 TaxID=3063957 RepID=UPI0026EE9A67|nr:hypothetical protein [Mariniflexile sp. AS56]MDO7170581.1 hypothetical protein [Mariniflexile sp. AS56]